MLFYLEAALFMLFLFSVALVGMIRPEEGDGEDSSSNSSSSSGESSDRRVKVKHDI